MIGHSAQTDQLGRALLHARYMQNCGREDFCTGLGKKDVLDLWLLRFGRLGRLITQVLLEDGIEGLHEGRIDHLLELNDPLPTLVQRNKAGILVDPLNPKGRVRPCYRVYHRLALDSVVHHIVDSELCMR